MSDGCTPLGLTRGARIGAAHSAENKNHQNGLSQGNNLGTPSLQVFMKVELL